MVHDGGGNLHRPKCSASVAHFGKAVAENYIFKCLAAALSRANLLKRCSKGGQLPCCQGPAVRYGISSHTKAGREDNTTITSFAVVWADMGQTTCKIDRLGTLELSALQST